MTEAKTREELNQFLRENVALFAGFDAAVVEVVADASDLRTFEGNEAIIECGEEGRFIGVLVSGRAEISVSDNLGGRIAINHIGPGEVFGEMSVLTGDRTVADVIAQTRCFVLLIPQEVVSARILVNPRAV